MFKYIFLLCAMYFNVNASVLDPELEAAKEKRTEQGIDSQVIATAERVNAARANNI